MNMRIDQAGNGILTFSINFLNALIVSDAGKLLANYGDIAFHNLAGKHIDNFCIFNDDIRFFTAGCDINQSF